MNNNNYKVNLQDFSMMIQLQEATDYNLIRYIRNKGNNSLANNYLIVLLIDNNMSRNLVFDEVISAVLVTKLAVWNFTLF